LSLFPTRECAALTAEQYNRVVREEIDGIKDFLVLHYHSTPRNEPMWAYCRDMPRPENLEYKEQQFARSGRIVLSTDELFRDASWFAVLIGQGHVAKDYNPLIDSIAGRANLEYLQRIRSEIQGAAAKLPTHESFLN
jgi:tryptophan 7-halogenase